MSHDSSSVVPVKVTSTVIKGSVREVGANGAGFYYPPIVLDDSWALIVDIGETEDQHRNSAEREFLRIYQKGFAYVVHSRVRLAESNNGFPTGRYVVGPDQCDIVHEAAHLRTAVDRAPNFSSIHMDGAESRAWEALPPLAI